MHCRALCVENPLLFGTGDSSGRLGCAAHIGNRNLPDTGGDPSAFSGGNIYRSRTLSLICDYSRSPSDPGTQAGRESHRHFSPSDPAFCISGIDHLRWIRVYSGAFFGITAIRNLQKMGFAFGIINYKDFSKILIKIYKQWEMFWTNKKFRV